MNKKLLIKGDRLKVYGSADLGLAANGRVMEATITQQVEVKSPNLYFNILLTHISGPLEGLTIRFSRVQAKKALTQITCHCLAYNYPHRKGAGQCKI